MQRPDNTIAPSRPRLAAFRAVAAAATLTLLTGSVAAQEASRFGVPRRVPTPTTLSGGTGLAWDGRVALCEPQYGDWRAVALRPTPTAMPVQADGFASLDHTTGTRAVSPGIVFAPGAAIWDDATNPPNSQTVTGIATHTFGGCNLIPDPAYSGAANPYASTQTGAPSPGGAYLTYQAWVICDQLQYIWDATATPPRWIQWIVNGLPLKVTGRVVLQIIVQNPGTDSAEVSQVNVLSTFAPFTDAVGAYITGLEPAAAFDGHLIIVQASKTQVNKAGELLAYVNPVAGGVSNWFGPLWLHELYNHRSVVVGGRTLEDRYPFVRQPIKDCDGSVYPTTTPYKGGYPWISWDGRFVLHTTHAAGVPTGHADLLGANGDRSNRGGSCVVGSLTGWQIWHIDGPTNPNRYAWTLVGVPGTNPVRTTNSTARLRLQCFGFGPGFWHFYRDHGAFPARPDHDFAYFPFVPQHRTLSEMSFDAWTDQDYAVYLPFNELLHRPSGQWTWDASRTPDTSGNGGPGTLNVGARFPCEEFGLADPFAQSPWPAISTYAQDALHGKIGQGIYFGAGGTVQVATNPRMNQQNLSGEVWIKLLEAPSGGVRIALHPGRFELRLDASSVPEVGVNSGGAWTWATGTTSLALDTWYHLGFSWEDLTGTLGDLIPLTGDLALYVDGVEEARVHPTLALATSSSPVEVGPGTTWTGQESVMILDQFALSRVTRRAAHFVAAAYRPLTPPAWSSTLPQLPNGLLAADARVPASNPYSTSVDKLGEILFHDVGLSVSGNTSCATCHVPALTFTDGLAKAIGHNGAPLRRGTPSLVNRLFSTTQFWDARAEDLEAQAFLPILAQDEMGMPSVQAVLNYLAADPLGLGYAGLFSGAFQTSVPTRDRVERALATYMRNILRGDSPEDRFRAGTTSALTTQALAGRELFFGKARCSACHNGANFTDERLWVTGLGLSGDRGAIEVTGLSRHKGAFKTPSLRNVSQTKPYFHDGSAATLADVVEFYDRGGVRAVVPIGQSVQNGLLAPDVNRPLGLTVQEKADLVHFLDALTGVGLSSNH